MKVQGVKCLILEFDEEYQTMTIVSEAEQTFFILRTGQLSRFTSKWNESWPGPWSCKTGPFSEWTVSRSKNKLAFLFEMS